MYDLASYNKKKGKQIVANFYKNLIISFLAATIYLF